LVDEFDLPDGAIALAYVEWAGESEQMLVVDWATSRDDCNSNRARSHGRAFVSRS
jgi:hypothetical protein